MIGVSLNHVNKTLGRTKVLEDLNLMIRPGEFLTLLGPSGCGKSTTLNLLAGLLTPDGGEIYFGDRLVNNVTPDKRDLAMVFQNYALYPHMTIYDNLAFPLRAPGRKLREEEIKSKIDQVSSLLGIQDLLLRFPKELSGGQQQRVSLGRAMVRDPKVFLLDEPLSNLDARLRIKMRKDIKALHQKLSSTIIYVTHDQSEAMTLSDRIAILNKGVLQQLGTPSEIYNKPANIFVAGFVGDREINLMQGKLQFNNFRAVFEGTGFNYELGDDFRDLSGAVGNSISLGIRGEDILVSASPSSERSIEARAQFSELVGADMILYVILPGGTELWCRVDPNYKLLYDQPLYIDFQQAKVHLFDTITGQTLLQS